MEWTDTYNMKFTYKCDRCGSVNYGHVRHAGEPIKRGALFEGSYLNHTERCNCCKHVHEFEYRMKIRNKGVIYER